MNTTSYLRWKLGELPEKLNCDFSRPSFSQFRRRYWKNRVYFYSHATPQERHILSRQAFFEFDSCNLQRMKKGLAPKCFQLTKKGTYRVASMQLHHVVQQQYGGQHYTKNIWEVTPHHHRDIHRLD